MSSRLLRLSIIALGFACLAGAGLSSSQRQPSSAPHYLFVWAGDGDRKDSDFLAVLDVTPAASQYGRVVTTLPVNESALFPHHTEHEIGTTKTLFANGFAGNRSFVFDLSKPTAPRILSRFGALNGLTYLHSFARLPNGHVLATFQGTGDEDRVPGGLAEIDDSGDVVRSVSVADPNAPDPQTLRPYSLVAVPELDRVVIGLTFMGFPRVHARAGNTEHAHSGSQVQIRRLSDLSLIKTIRLPPPAVGTPDKGPHEPRVLADGRTVLVGTQGCDLYQVTGLPGLDPATALVHQISANGSCWVPVVIGNYWIQANTEERRVVALDVSDLTHVRQVSQVTLGEEQRPHWLATDGSRVVVVNDGGGENRMWMLNFDRTSGSLRLDEAFRNAGSAQPGFSFAQVEWPHGATGGAIPHGTVFSR